MVQEGKIAKPSGSFSVSSAAVCSRFHTAPGNFLYLRFWGGESLPVLSLNKARQSKACRIP